MAADYHAPAGSRRIEILIVGAGMTGLTAASILHKAGRKVLVVDKGRGVGGRMATRRIGEAVFDHGAQFVTADTDRFSSLVNNWHQAGVLRQWCRRPDTSLEEQVHWRGNPSMTAIARHLAEGLDIQLSWRAISLRTEGEQWVIEGESGETLVAESVLLTAPVPQSLSLLDAGQVPMDPEVRVRLEGLSYERCLAVLAVLDRAPMVPAPGLFQPPDGPVALIVDNQTKGISSVPAVTLHATPDFSEAVWDRDRTESGKKILEAAMPILKREVIDFQVHGWRYSRPISTFENPCLLLNQAAKLVLAGDSFTGGRIECAEHSGRAAARLFA